MACRSTANAGAWIALVMMSACASWAQSPKSSGTTHVGPAKEPNATKQERQSDYPTNNKPLPVQIIQSPTEANHADQREQSSEKYNQDNLRIQTRSAVAAEQQADVARTAAVILAAESLIALAALIFLICTYRQTKRTADAATLAAQAAVGVEIPKLMLSEIVFGNWSARTWEDLMKPVERTVQTREDLVIGTDTRVTLTNYGRTPAFVTQQSLEIVCARTLPEEPNYAHARDLEAGTVVEGKDPYILSDLGHLDSAENLTALNASKKYVFVFGYVSYDDFLGKHHRCGFCKKIEKVPVERNWPPKHWFFMTNCAEGTKYTESY